MIAVRLQGPTLRAVVNDVLLNPAPIQSRGRQPALRTLEEAQQRPEKKARSLGGDQRKLTLAALSVCRTSPLMQRRNKTHVTPYIAAALPKKIASTCESLSLRLSQAILCTRNDSIPTNAG